MTWYFPFSVCLNSQKDSLTYKTEGDSQSLKLKESLWLPGVGAGEDGGRDIPGLWGGMYTLLYLKWIVSKYLECSTGNSVQCYVAVWMGEGLRGNGYMRVRGWVLSLFTETLTQCLLIGYIPVQNKSFFFLSGLSDNIHRVLMWPLH